MKIMNKIKYFAVVLATLVATTSCLDKLPASAIPADEAMQSFDDASQTVTGIYSMMKSSALWSGHITLLPDIQTDLVYAVDGYSNTYGQHWLWNIRSTNSEVEAVYASLYSIISNCNFYLERIDDIIAKQVDDNNITILEQYTGEVYTIRALCYSELIKFFCNAYDPATADTELGVVLRKTYSKEEPSVRATLKESYEFVVADLEMAENILDSQYDIYSSYYMTNAVAHALHARVALYMQDWDAAIQHASAVIDHENGMYSLSAANVLYTNEMTFFDYMWNNDLATETIWQVGFTPTSYGGALGQVFLNFTTDYTYYYPDYVPAQWALDLYGSGDMRLNSYFATLSTGYDHALTWPLLVKYYGNQSFISNYIYHVSMPKPFRLAEQYLIRAEAYCRKSTPDFSKATADMNTLRASRFSGGGGSISLSADNFITEIANERVRELFMEGHRLQDIKRWGKLYNNGNGFSRTPQLHTLTEGSSISIKADDPRLVWPIPQHELEAPGSQVLPNKSNN
ncbi:MAG: RagB/SusD family nutrient uptake outer membrane protein [Tidjanibacter sp.]|nr:RagB/SusD family nutrient uptake outer membrane protein [Tidjanibacter sp.]